MKDKSIYVKLAQETIENLLNGIETNWETIPQELKIKRGCFVTLHKKNGELRGCIGTISPMYSDLYTEIKSNAAAAAFRDYRFNPLQTKEMENIYISVDILSQLEKTSFKELDPKKYGIVVSFKGRRGVLLPDLEGVNSAEYQLEIAMSKAGIPLSEKDGVTIERFTVARYF